MNREERRKFVKRARKEGYSRGAAEAYLAVKELSDAGEMTQKMFEDGDEVIIDVHGIMKRNDYGLKSDKYKDMITEHEGEVFKVRNIKGNIYALDGLQGWIFWGGDLISVETSGGGD